MRGFTHIRAHLDMFNIYIYTNIIIYIYIIMINYVYMGMGLAQCDALQACKKAANAWMKACENSLEKGDILGCFQRPATGIPYLRIPTPDPKCWARCHSNGNWLDGRGRSASEHNLSDAPKIRAKTQLRVGKPWNNLPLDRFFAGGANTKNYQNGPRLLTTSWCSHATPSPTAYNLLGRENLFASFTETRHFRQALWELSLQPDQHIAPVQMSAWCGHSTVIHF